MRIVLAYAYQVAEAVLDCIDFATHRANTALAIC